jgi:hypothetical protein
MGQPELPNLASPLPSPHRKYPASSITSILFRSQTRPRHGSFMCKAQRFSELCVFNAFEKSSIPPTTCYHKEQEKSP